jgi:hypothetical protein
LRIPRSSRIVVVPRELSKTNSSSCP